MFVPLAMAVVFLAGGVRIAQDVRPAAPLGPSVSIEPVRALYLTSGVAGSARFAHFLDLLRTTTVNALVIDLKDANGRLAFTPTSDALRALASGRATITDLLARVRAIHERGGLAIARIPVFQDSWYAERHPAEALQLPGGAVWRDRLGYAWLDPASRAVAQYAVDLAREATALGFDEVNFDYLRFPSEGPRFRDIRYPRWDGKRAKHVIIRDFARTLDRELRARGTRTSADLFGQVLWNRDDLGIGQQFEELAPHFDVIAPMVYPSHYRSGFLGKVHPAQHPYAVVAATLARGMGRLDRIPEEHRPAVRPWLQAFHIGGSYGAKEIAAQIAAGEDSGTTGWMLWNPRGRYVESALGKR